VKFKLNILQLNKKVKDITAVKLQSMVQLKG